MRLLPVDRLVGDSSRLPFDVLLSLRSQFIARPLPTVLSILAVAASVALAASVEMASRAVSAALEKSMKAAAGVTQLEITAAGQGVREELIDVVRGMPGVRSASPIISETVRLTKPAGGEEALRIVGLDLLYDREVRDYGVAESGFRVRDHLRLVASADSLVLSEGIAKRLGIGEGDRLTLRSTKGTHTVTVRGYLLGDLASAYGGALAVMDVFALQKMLGWDRRVDRIDIAAEGNWDTEALLVAIQKGIGEEAVVRHSQLRENVVTPILAAYSFGIWAITLIGVLVGLFLTYAAMSIAVDRRTVEFALLRSAGMDARRASLAVVADASILAGIGSLLGLTLALSLGGRLTMMFSRASRFYQDLSIEPASASAATVAAALAVGIPMALVACVEPARRIGQSRPMEILAGRSGVGVRKGRLATLAACGTASLGMLLGAVSCSAVAPGLRLGVSVCFGVVAVWALASALLSAAISRMQTLLASVVPRLGVLAGAFVGDRPLETGVTVATWAAVVAAAFSLLVTMGNLGSSIDEFFAGESGPGAVMAFAEDPSSTSSFGRLPIDAAVATAIASTPGVTGAWASRATTVMFRGVEIPVDDYDVDQLTRHGGLRSISDDPDSAIAALRRGELLASDAFRSRFKVEVGDSITLSTARGPRRFKVGGASRSFRGPNGKLSLESAQFSRWFRTEGAEAIVFWVHGSVEDVLARVRNAVPDRPIFFREGEALRRQGRRVIGRFGALLMVPFLVVASIGLIGLANILIGNVAARRRDLALMRASGGTALNILAAVGLSGSVVAVFGTGFGIFLGFCWAAVLRDAITGFLGWRISLTVESRLVAGLLAAGMVAATCAAIGPALLSIRERPRSGP